MDFIDGHRVLECVGQGGTGQVYRVQGPDSQGQLALKLLRPAVAATPLDRVRFRREFRVASELSHPALVRVHRMGSYQDQLYYTMDLVTGRTLKEELEPGPDREAWLARVTDLFARLVQAVAYIHEHGVVHRDLKPGNVLVDAQGIPRLLDFGLARRGEDSLRVTEPGMLVGTVHYMAPEQIAGEEVDYRSDLYSLGVMLYEVLAGVLPFDQPDLVALLYAILHHEPAPLRQHISWVPPDLEATVMRLLQREPADRIQSAGELYTRLTGRVLDGSVAAPPLFTPRFTGRGPELTRILRLASGVVLLHGTGGSGKTRLLREVARQARSVGRTVVAVQCDERETVCYSPWSAALRRLLPGDLPRQLEPFRRGLSSLLPELGTPDSEEPERKFHLFEGMLRLLTLRPVLLLVDDLHRADPASLEFFRFLTGRAGTNLVVVASASCDAGVPAEGTVNLTLGPLTEDQSRQLLESMIGSGPVDPQASARLHSDSEGNPLFLVELVKAMVADGQLRQEAGCWRLTGGGAVPATVRDAIELRLNGLDPGDLSLARLAAVLGTFSFELLAQASEAPPEEVLERLERLVHRKILREDSFPNRLLVEVLLQSVDRERLTRLHAQAARALAAQANPARLAARLAHHYHHSGQAREAAAQRVLAGDAAAQAFAFQEAVQFYEDALPFRDTPELREKLADAWAGWGQAERAREAYLHLLRHASERLDRARIWRKVGSTWERQGRPREAHHALTQALLLLGVSLPSGGLHATLGFPLRAIRFWLQQRALVPAASVDRARAQQLEPTMEEMVRVLFYLRSRGWVQDMFDLTVRQLLLDSRLQSERTRNQVLLFQGYVATFLSRLALPGARRMLSLAARRIREQPGDDLDKATRIAEASYLLLTVGDVPRALRTCQLALQLGTRLGDVYGLSLTHNILFFIQRYRGKVGQARDHARAALQHALDSDNQVNQVMSTINLGSLSGQDGDVGSARAYLDEAADRLARMELPLMAMLLGLGRAWAALASGDPYEACRHVESLNRQAALRQTRFFQGQFRMLQACVAVDLAASDPGHFKTAVNLARRGRAGDYTVYEAVIRRKRGQLQEMLGRPEAANHSYLEALDLLDDVANPLEAGKTHRRLARLYRAAGDGRAEGHEREAEQCFLVAEKPDPEG
ncbi:MAG: protein kinase [Candidatus Eremiobacterota bacterium]